MKIVLLKDVKNVGRKFDIKEVSDGYALNLLIPNGQALKATAGALKSIELEKQRHLAEQKVHQDLLEKNIVDVSGVTVIMQEKANEKGHLFAAVHKAEIIKPLQEQTRIQLNAENIILEAPIKTVGEFKIPVKAGEKTGEFTLKIEAVK